MNAPRRPCFGHNRAADPLKTKADQPYFVTLWKAGGVLFSAPLQVQGCSSHFRAPHLMAYDLWHVRRPRYICDPAAGPAPRHGARKESGPCLQGCNEGAFRKSGYRLAAEGATN